ncbi:MAG TPA: LacI family DNA-binding transcriptional regulator [Solirubrobacteraceae bacterium]|nr:LacI family DNA-binding transcriptional regulator [Solirubrobacteraceae bacterium]
MPSSARNPTSHDIAREAGVSQSTVSRTLRDDPRVDPLTAQRVREVAKRLGYTPNSAARSLVTRRTRTVAVVVADITNPFYPQLVEALHEQLGRAGYRMILFNERTDVRGDTGLDMMLNGGGADGAVFLSVTIGRGVAELLAASPVPTVLLNRDADGAVVDRVMADHIGGATQVGRLLVSLGHRRIAFIGGPANTSTSRDREAGLADTLQQAGVPLDSELRRRGEFTHQSGFQWATELLSGEDPPTAIFCANDVIAFGAIDAARRLQIDVPRQLSIAGFDDIPMAGWDSFSLTTVRQPLADMARQAARILIDRIEGSDESEPTRIVFPTNLIQRATTGPASAP